MEKRVFIEKMTDYLLKKDVRRRKFVGDCVYIPLKNGINIKFYCLSTYVAAKAISKLHGEIDYVELPFSEYFVPKKCSPGAPSWCQSIENGRWRYGETYAHVLPTGDDYKNLATGMTEFIKLYDGGGND